MKARADSEIAREKLRKFGKNRDLAFFHATLFTSLELSANLARSKESAQKALDLFLSVQEKETPVGKEEGAVPVLEFRPVYFVLSAPQRRAVRASCYELLLMLAEILAHPVPGQPSEQQRLHAGDAARVLKAAATLGVSTRSLHRRLARYHVLLGQEKDAEKQQGLADAFQIQPGTESKVPEEHGPPDHVPLRQARAIDFFLLALDHYREEQWPQAVVNFEHAARLQPDYFWAHYYRGICHLRARQPAQAETSLSAGLALRDLLWGYLYRGYARGELAERARASGEKSNAPSGEPLPPEPAGAHGGSQPPECLSEADAHFEAAAGDFQKALTLHPDKGTRYVLFLHRGALRIRQKKLDLAIDDLQNALDLKPNEYQAHMNLALAYLSRKQFDQALACLDSAIRLGPNEAEAYRARARVFLALQEPASALAPLEQAVRLAPAGSPALAGDLLLRGQILLRDRQYVKAVHAFEETLAIQPDLAAALLGKGAALLRAAEAETDPDKKHALLQNAERSYESYLNDRRQKPPAPEAYRSRGLARALLGDVAGAVADYTHVLTTGSDPVTHVRRGWLYLQSAEKVKEALADFEAALLIRPELVDAYLGRGTARVKLGQDRAARADAEEALRRGPRSTRLLFFAARIYAQAAPRSAKEPGQIFPAGRTNGPHSQELALQWLRQAVDLLPAGERARFWRDRVLADPAFDSLAHDSGFAKLERRYAGTATTEEDSPRK